MCGDRWGLFLSIRCREADQSGISCFARCHEHGSWEIEDIEAPPLYHSITLAGIFEHIERALFTITSKPSALKEMPTTLLSQPLTVLLTSALLALPGFQVAKAEVSQETLQSISIPDKVETSIGDLEFFDGVPTDATVTTVYDNLDRMRGTQVFLDNVGAVSMYSVRTGLADPVARGANRIAIFEQLLDSQPLSSPPTRRRCRPIPIPTSPRTGQL